MSIAGEEENSDLRLFLDRFPTRTVVLLDPSRRERLYPDVAKKIAEWGFETNVFCSVNPGDHVAFSRNGRRSEK